LSEQFQRRAAERRKTKKPLRSLTPLRSEWRLEAKDEKELDMHENDISGIILDAAIEAHRTLGGPGLLESAYEEALVWELQARGLAVERQKNVPIVYKGHTLATPLRLDLLVADKVIVECKGTTQYNPIFEAQALTYLRLTGLKLGIVINFGARRVKDGYYRVVNGLSSEPEGHRHHVPTA
jgi:GxxExxY protein